MYVLRSEKSSYVRTFLSCTTPVFKLYYYIIYINYL